MFGTLAIVFAAVAGTIMNRAEKNSQPSEDEFGVISFDEKFMD